MRRECAAERRWASAATAWSEARTVSSQTSATRFPPPAADPPEVGAELALPGQLGPGRDGGQPKGLRDVWHGAAHQPEVDTAWALEADGLDGGRHETTHSSEVRGQDHVRAALPHLQLLL